MFCVIKKKKKIHIKKHANIPPHITMKVSLILIAAALLVLLATIVSVQAGTIEFSDLTEEERMSYVVSEVEEQEISESALSPQARDFMNQYRSYVKNFTQVGKAIVAQEQEPSSEEAITLAVILNVASKAWKFIQDNKAVYEANKFYGNALPKGKTAFELERWKAPTTVTYSASWKNLYGITVGNLKYSFSFIPGGRATDAAGNTGLYLDRVTIIPNDVFVAWGYKANAETSISSVTNAGTTKAPIAAATVDLRFVFGSLNKETLTHSFYCKADGSWKKLH